MHFVFSHEVHGKILNRHRQIIKGTVGAMLGVDERSGLFAWELLVKFQLKAFFVKLRREMSFHGTNKRPGAKIESFKILFASFWGYSVSVVVCVPHSDKVSCAVDIFAPVLPCLIPSFVRLVGAKP